MRAGERDPVVKLALLIALAGCSSAELLPPVVRVKAGPASARPIKRIVAVPATCGTLGLETIPPSTSGGQATFVPKTCSPEAVAGADQIIRLGLAFRGHDVIDSEDVNVITAKRVETQTAEQSSTSVDGRTSQTASDSTEIERVGARFEDAPPLEQAAILAELRADAVLSARIWIGSSIGMSGRHVVIAQVQLLATADRALVWARRCELEIAGFGASETVGIEQATRCAMEGAK